jgi:hypothetical protein
MTPTNKLRFVKRKAPGRTMESGTGYYLSEVLEVRVLQQWWKWENVPVSGGKWRDVPLEEEV